jgi:hypothetical protein
MATEVDYKKVVEERNQLKEDLKMLELSLSQENEELRQQINKVVEENEKLRQENDNVVEENEKLRSAVLKLYVEDDETLSPTAFETLLNTINKGTSQAHKRGVPQDDDTTEDPIPHIVPGVDNLRL